MKRINVALGARSYPIQVGPNSLPALVSRVRQLTGHSKLFLFFDAGFYALHGERVLASFAKQVPIESLVLPSGESTKSESQLSRLYDFVLSRRIARDDLIVAFGGGVTTDLVGYLAATVLRGVRWVAVPTTLLGMVDAAIGGKTGINHRSGKNLIGAFWQPTLVHCDPVWLGTLPERHMTAGFGEILKYGGLVGGKPLSNLATLNPDRMFDPRILEPVIAECIRIKARYVSRDEREQEIRIHLNLGHTVGHAIERAQRLRGLLHGEAVILGLNAALHAGDLFSPGAAKSNAVYRELIRRWILRLPRYDLSREEIMTAVGLDKKRRSGGLRMVLLESPGKPRVAEHVPPGLLSEAITRMLSDYRARRK